MSTDPELRDRIREILLSDWDPDNVARNEWARASYDPFIDPLIELIRNGADAEAIADWLLEREKEFMCFPGLGTGRLMSAARKLATLRSQL